MADQLQIQNNSFLPLAVQLNQILSHFCTHVFREHINSLMAFYFKKMFSPRNWISRYLVSWSRFPSILFWCLNTFNFFLNLIHLMYTLYIGFFILTLKQIKIISYNLWFVQLRGIISMINSDFFLFEKKNHFFFRIFS